MTANLMVSSDLVSIKIRAILFYNKSTTQLHWIEQ